GLGRRPRLEALGIEIGAAVLFGEIAHDAVAFPQAEIAVVDDGHHADRIDLAEHGIVGRSEAAPPILALVLDADLVEHPQHLADVDRVGAPVDLEHRVSPLAMLGAILDPDGRPTTKKMPAVAPPARILASIAATPKL